MSVERITPEEIRDYDEFQKHVEELIRPEYQSEADSFVENMLESLEPDTTLCELILDGEQTKPGEPIRFAFECSVEVYTVVWYSGNDYYGG